MPYSSNEGKKESFAWIRDNIGKNARILDVGPGACTYGCPLKALGYYFVDGVEIEPSYVRKFRQEEHYRQIYVSDIRKWEPAHAYELVIFGDILEHVSVEDARAILHRFRKSWRLVSVPWNYHQGPLGGVEAERHIQDSLTPESVERDYSPDTWLFQGPVIGVFLLAPEAY